LLESAGGVQPLSLDASFDSPIGQAAESMSWLEILAAIGNVRS
jgi:hypothetical protein